MQPMTPATESPVPTSPNTDTLTLLLTVVLFVWLEVLVFVSLVPFWVNQLVTADGADGNFWLIPSGALLIGGLMALPLAFMRIWKRSPRYEAIFQTWFWGALFFLVMLPLRLLPQNNILLVNVVQIGLALLFTWGVRRGASPRPVQGWGLGGIVPALLFAIPWVVMHSLGSSLDTLLNLLAGLAFGAAVAAILERSLVPMLNLTGTAVWNIALGGLATGVLLNMMVAGYGVQGVPYLLMLCVPTLGWVVMAYYAWGTATPTANGRATMWLVGLAIAAPLMLVDPDETIIAMNTDWDILAAGIVAALWAMPIGWLLGFIAFLLRGTLAKAENRVALPTLAAVGATVVGVGLIYAVAGQPGWYGERLFVILRDQADLSATASIPDQRDRATAVYETLTAHANSTQSDLRSTLTTLNIRHRPYYLVNAIEVDGGPLVRLWLMTRPEVERVLDSPVLRPVYNTKGEAPAEGDAKAPSRTRVLWNLEMIGAPQVWEEFGARGAGIVVGQSDSGVEVSHPELEDSYLGRDGNHDLHWYDPWRFQPTPYDQNGHGTHTIGSVLGNRVGVAPDAEFIACANLERNLANPALYLECMQFMLAPFTLASNDPFAGFPEQGAQVLNNSWGCPSIEGCDANALLSGVEALRAAGIFVVASAGNSGPSCGSVDAPLALYDAAFTVGANNRHGQITNFSSRGPVSADGSGRIKPDVVAPGEDILSSFPNGTYASHQGTSMAGPHVAGAVALMWSANPDLIGDIDRTEQLLIDTATPVTDTVSCGDEDAPTNSYGYGMINVYEAVRASFE